MNTGPDDPADAWRDALRGDDPRRLRERDLRRYGPRRGPSTWIYWTVAVVGLVLFAGLMRGVMEKTKWTASAPDEGPGDGDLTTPRAARGPVVVGCYELLDPHSGTWLDRCGGSRGPITPAQRAELARAAAAARRR